MNTRCASVTIDGIEYVLPYDGEKIVNVSGRPIPAGAVIYLVALASGEPELPKGMVHESLSDVVHECTDMLRERGIDPARLKAGVARTSAELRRGGGVE